MRAPYTQVLCPQHHFGGHSSHIGVDDDDDGEDGDDGDGFDIRVDDDGGDDEYQVWHKEHWFDNALQVQRRCSSSGCLVPPGQIFDLDLFGWIKSNISQIFGPIRSTSFAKYFIKQGQFIGRTI